MRQPRDSILFYFRRPDDGCGLGGIFRPLQHGIFRSVFPDHVLGGGGFVCVYHHKLFVFQSTSLKLSRLFSELVSFVACRLFTGILTIAGMELMVNGLGWSNLFGKIAVSVLSLVLNYILSKLFIFRGREAVSEKQGK